MRLISLGVACTTLLSVSLLAACSDAEPSPVDADPDGCRGGKCDGFEAPSALDVITLDDVLSCRATVDDETDPFFAVHALHCRLDAPEGLVVGHLYYETRASDGDVSTASSTEPGTIGEELRVVRLRDDDLPARFRASIGFHTEGEDPFQDLRWWGFEVEIADREALRAWTEEAPLELGLPLEIWPVVLWPSQDVVTDWKESPDAYFSVSTDYTFGVEGSAELAVGGVSALTEAEVRVFERHRGSDLPDIAALSARPLHLLMPMGGPTEPTALEVRLHSGTATTPLEGPGYYVIGPDGTPTLTDPGALPALTTPAVETDAGTSVVTDGGMADAATAAEDGGSAEMDAGASEPDAGPPDPCLGACSDSEACVEGECIARDGQDQDLRSRSTAYCVAPDRACDDGEDADCAEGHGCVAGLCRRLSCQVQHLRSLSETSCEPAAQPCESDAHCGEGHTCYDGLCRRTACQNQDLRGTSSSSCEEPDHGCARDVDCADEHACVEGLCRRVACQTQLLRGLSSNFCEDAAKPCAEDTHCADEHACVMGLCRRLACQNQDLLGLSNTSCEEADQPCDTDAHCVEAHTCVEGLCRRTACQNQDLRGLSSTSCEDPDQPCARDVDCAAAHVCGDESLCLRNACLP